MDTCEGDHSFVEASALIYGDAVIFCTKCGEVRRLQLVAAPESEDQA